MFVPRDPSTLTILRYRPMPSDHPFLANYSKGSSCWGMTRLTKCERHRDGRVFHHHTLQLMLQRAVKLVHQGQTLRIRQGSCKARGLTQGSRLGDMNGPYSTPCAASGSFPNSLTHFYLRLSAAT